MSLMHSLRMRPMLLASIEDLMDADMGQWNEHTVFQALVERWFDREKQKNPALDLDALRRACELPAIRLQEKREWLISAEDLVAFAAKQSDLETLQPLGLEARSLLNKASEDGCRFAHYSIQEFFVVRAIKQGVLHEPLDRTEMLDWFGAIAGISVNVEHVDHHLWPGVLAIGANLSGADLTAANLGSAILHSAQLHSAILHNASLHGADLSGADFTSADFTGATFHRGDLTRATLQGANLTQEQLNLAHGNHTTILPEGLEYPDHWPSGRKQKSRKAVMYARTDR